MGIVEQYLLQLKNEKRRWRRAAAILTVLSLLVATGVSWNLRMTGITIANGATCGQEEHQHTEECPMEKVLICGYGDRMPTEVPAEAPTEAPPDEPTEAPTEAPTEEPAEAATEAPTEERTQEETVADVVMNVARDVFSGFALTAHAAELPTDYQSEEVAPGHIHTDECYEITWLCQIEEHIHVLSCYADTTADVESAAVWEADLPELTNDWAEDIVRIAQSQLGCGESERNYVVADDGKTRSGITRYGQWYGNPYGDWSGMFVMFCLTYGEIPQDAIPQSPGVYNMMRLAQDTQIFLQPDENIGSRGNLLFLDTDENGNADRIAVVCACENNTITAISGDCENTVAAVTLAQDDPDIMGYINIGQIQEVREAQKEPTPSEPAEETVPEETLEGSGEMDTEPAISLDVEFPEEGIMRLTAQITNIEESQYIWQWQVSENGNDPWTDIDGATELVCELEDTEENFRRYYRIQGHEIPAQNRAITFAVIRDNSGVQQQGSTITSGAISPFRIDQTGNNNNTVYTIDVYALPVDSDGIRIAALEPVSLGTLRVNNSNKTAVRSKFNESLGEYRSAYFGSESAASADNIDSVWRYNRGKTYYLAYSRTDGTTNNQGFNGDSTASLYLRYIPEFTVRFESEGFQPVTETVQYQQLPTLTEPGTWTREGYTLLGWTANGNEQNVYSYQELMQLRVTENVTYTAKWADQVSVHFNLGEYVSDLYPIEKMDIPYGSAISLLPIPIWKNNQISVAFDGWYLDEGLTQPVTSDYQFYENTILYVKWSSTDDGYYVYFMDFRRDGQEPLVLTNYSVTEGQLASPYTPGNAPEGKQWDGKWYLDKDCTNAYSFNIPVSQMTEYLTGANGRDLYLYPGMQDICRAIFVTYGTRVDPVTVVVGGTIDLDQYKPERAGFEFAGWKTQDGTAVSGVQTLTQTTTFYASWNPGYVPFEAILRIENANDTGMTQSDILGTWYAKAGSRIRVKSTYSGSADRRSGNHAVVCVIDGVEYPVYKDAALSQQATLSDVYSTYFLYNNTGTAWTDEVNWDDIYTGGELPYSTRPVSSAGDTIINFDYMRVRSDLVFSISNTSAYIDIFRLYQNNVLTGSVTYTGTKPTATGSNVSATGVTGTNVSWTYTANSSGTNYYTLHDLKYGQRIYDVYPVGGSYLTNRNANSPFYTYDCNGTNYTSRREDLSSDFFSGSGRSAKTYQLKAEFDNNSQTALMYAIRCLEGEQADFTINNVGYKVQPQLCEVVNSSGTFSAKQLLGCAEGANAKGSGYYSNLSTTNNTVGGTSVKQLFGQTYWSYYDAYNGVDKLSDIDRAYIFYYDRLYMSLQFNFAYDSNGDGSHELAEYQNISYGEKLDEYRYGSPDSAQNPLLIREGYEFAGWLDANGFVLEEEDWESMVATGDSEDSTMIFIAKWEKLSNSIVEYYEDRSSSAPFESHYFDDGELLQYPTMTVYPEGWVWQEYGQGQYQRFDWDVPMYGEYGTQEIRQINGEEQVVNVIRIYGTWDESHTKVVYDPNAAQGGIPGTAPTDSNEYTIWQSEVPVATRGDTANTDPGMVFVGWQLDRDGVVYQAGDHVPVRWPRTMIFSAQWAKAEEVVYLRYDPNGGTPDYAYPNSNGLPYKKNATASVWNNTNTDGSSWYTRAGYKFTGWNTEADGSGTSYASDTSITLTSALTTLYAQWEKTTYTLSVNKVDSESGIALTGAEFGLYKQSDNMFLLVQSFTTGVDGHITFQDLEIDTLYKLVEDRPPNGYAIICREIFFTVKPDGNMTSLYFYDSEGNAISMPDGVYGEYITGNKRMNLTVQNLRGYVLPSTGGMGIGVYLLCGLMFVSAPLVYIYRQNRRYERRNRG